MAHILIVEDEKSINDLIAMNLKLVGHTCEQAFDGKAALELINSNTYSLILLDIMLPEIDGFELIQHVPKSTPVIFLTAKGNLSDRVKGLKLGADDYITKPFESVELLARIDAILRRIKRDDNVFILNDTKVDLDERKIFVNNEEVEITGKEFKLIETLIKNKNIALSRDKLLELAWGYNFCGESRTIDVHIQKIRKKLKWEDNIKTVFKTGYRLEVN